MARRPRTPEPPALPGLPPLAQDAVDPLDAILGDVDPGTRALVKLQAPEHQADVAHHLVKVRRARATSRAADRSGKLGEAWVEDHHVRAVEDLGLAAAIWKVGAPWVPHVVGGRLARDRRGRVLGAVVDVAPPDYLGVLDDGRALVVEAKRRSGRLARDAANDDGTENRAAIETHQTDDLTKVAATDALSLVVVTFVRSRARQTYEVRVAVPWSILATRWRSPGGGGLSVGPEDLDDWRVTSDCYLARFVPAGV